MDFGTISKESLERITKWNASYFTHPASYYPVPQTRDLIVSRKYFKRGGNQHERMSRTLQTMQWGRERKTKQVLFHQLCTRSQKLEHGTSFLFQIAAWKVQSLQFLENQFSCLRHLTVRVSLLSVTRKFPKSSSPLSLNLSRWMDLKETRTVTMMKQNQRRL